MKSLDHDIVATCDETVDTLETTSVKFVYKKGYYLLYTIFLATMCPVLLIFNAIVFYSSHKKQ